MNNIYNREDALEFFEEFTNKQDGAIYEIFMIFFEKMLKLLTLEELEEVKKVELESSKKELDLINKYIGKHNE